MDGIRVVFFARMLIPILSLEAHGTDEDGKPLFYQPQPLCEQLLHDRAAADTYRNATCNRRYLGRSTAQALQDRDQAARIEDVTAAREHTHAVCTENESAFKAGTTAELAKRGIHL